MQLFLPACKLAMPKESLLRQSLIMLMMAQNNMFLQNQQSKEHPNKTEIYIRLLRPTQEMSRETNNNISYG